jgi:hypothetical protein
MRKVLDEGWRWMLFVAWRLGVADFALTSRADGRPRHDSHHSGQQHQDLPEESQLVRIIKRWSPMNLWRSWMTVTWIKTSAVWRVKLPTSLESWKATVDAERTFIQVSQALNLKVSSPLFCCRRHFRPSAFPPHLVPIIRPSLSTPISYYYELL